MALFALTFLPVFLALLALHPRLLPTHQAVVVAGANLVLPRLDPPIRLGVGPDGGWRSVTIAPDGSERFYWSRPRANLHLLHLGVVLLPALLLATPVSIRRRLASVAVGSVLLLAFDALAAVLLVRTIVCLHADPASVACAWVKTVVNSSGQVVSAVLWALLTWDVWLPRPAGADSPEGPAGGAPAVERPGRAERPG